MNRKRLPTTRESVTHKVTIGTMKVYISVGLYENGQPGELFIHNIEGPEVGAGIKGMADQWAIAISMLLQASYTIDELEKKFAHARYEPNGFTDNHKIRNCKSITDYIIRWMKERWGTK